MDPVAASTGGLCRGVTAGIPGWQQAGETQGSGERHTGGKKRLHGGC